MELLPKTSKVANASAIIGIDGACGEMKPLEPTVGVSIDFDKGSPNKFKCSGFVL